MGNPVLREVRSLAQAHPLLLKNPVPLGVGTWPVPGAQYTSWIRKGVRELGLDLVLSCLWM